MPGMVAPWVKGVLMNILGSIVSNAGTLLLKFDFGTKESRSNVSSVGLALFMGGTFISFVSFAYAAQSMLAGVSALQFVSNILISWWMLGERICNRRVSGGLIMLAGVTLLICSGRESQQTGLDVLFDQYFLMLGPGCSYFVCLTTALVLLSSIFKCYTGVLPFWLHEEGEQAVNRALKLPHSRVAHFIVSAVYVVISAIIGGQSVVSGKLLSHVSKEWLAGDMSHVYSVRTMVAILFWCATAALWVVHLNRALRLFSGTVVIPLTQASWTLSTIVSGGIVYGEFEAMSARELEVFACGVALLVVGVALLAPDYGAVAHDERALLTELQVPSANMMLKRRHGAVGVPLEIDLQLLGAE